MSRTASNSAIYRPDLGQAVMEYVEGDSMGYIGLEVMPLFATAKQSSTYPVIPKEALLKAPDTARAPRGKYNRGDWEYERGQFATAENGWEEPMDDSERELFDQEAPGVADLVASQRAFNHIMRGQEQRIANKVFNANNFTAHAVSTEWDTLASCAPVDDVSDGISAFRLQCGMLPDALIISYATFLNLKNCDQVVDRIKYTFAGIDINRMTSAQLAQVFGVPRVLVGGAVVDSAKRGASASIADVWNKEYAALVKISAGADLMQPGVGRTFLWTADSAQNPIVEQYREDSIRSDIFRVRHNTDEAFMQSKDSSGNVVSNIAAACVYLFSNIHT